MQINLLFTKTLFISGIKGCSLVLTVQIFSAKDKSINANFEVVLWNHIEMYNYALCYMLYKLHVYHYKEVFETKFGFVEYDCNVPVTYFLCCNY